MNSVVFGSADSNTSARRTPSMLETNSQRGRPGGEGVQRLDGHRRPQIRAADPDVDHQPEGLAGAATDATAAHALGEREHARTLGHDERLDLRAADRLRRAAGAAPRAAPRGPRWC